jgi:predicted phage terminase large subunit-like protein
LVAVWRKEFNRLVINCPPRFAKSTIVNVCFPVWVWLQDPKKDFLCCSYEIDLALNMNLDRRRLMDSKWFRDLFAECFTLATDRSQAGDFSNSAGGAMQAASTNSKAQGRGGDIIVVDDPLSADFAHSESFRNETNLWFVNQLPQRLNHPSESAIVLIMQRLHQNDPSGFLLGQEECEWTLLKLALVAEEDERWVFPISGRVWTRKKGECLDPRRWSPKTIRQRQQNRLVWAGQFQQSPMAAEGNIIRTDDILYFGGRDPKTGELDPGLPESFERKIISVDCSFKDLRTSDYVAIIVVGIVGSRRYLLHVTNAHLDLTGTENEIRNARAAFGPISATLVEDKSNGSSVIAHLKEEISGLVAVNPEGGKLARLVAASPEFQARNWSIERNGPWTHKVVEQLTMFPNCKNDDIADGVSQAAIWLQANTYELGLLDYLKRVATGARKVVASVAERLRGKPSAKPEVVGTALVSITRDQWAEWKRTNRAPACPNPNCKSTATVILGSNIHCNSCGRDNGQDLPGGEKPGHVHRWHNIPGGQKCDDCGEQTGAVVIAGMSRAEYQRTHGYQRFQ